MTAAGLNAAQIARNLLIECCGPYEGYGHRKFWLAHGASVGGLTVRRASGIFYFQARSITADEVQLLTERVEALRRKLESRGRLHAETLAILGRVYGAGRGGPAGDAGGDAGQRGNAAHGLGTPGGKHRHR